MPIDPIKTGRSPKFTAIDSSRTPDSNLKGESPAIASPPRGRQEASDVGSAALALSFVQRTRRLAALVTALAAIAALTFLIRSLPVANFASADGTRRFYGPDSYDHLRQVRLTLETFPRVPTRNSYRGFPEGSGLLWSPGFDWAVAAGLLAAQPLGSPHDLLEPVAFWLSPALATATVLFLFLLCRKRFGTFPALVGSFVLAVLPGHVIYSLVSEFDHHAAEPLLFLLIVAAMTADTPTQGDLYRRWTGALLTGAALAMALLVWRGSTIFLGASVLALALDAATSGWRGERPRSVHFAAVAFLSSAAALATYSLAIGLGLSDSNSRVVSWFHVAALLASASAVFAAFTIASQARMHPVRATAACLAVACLSVVALVTPLGQELLAGVGVLAASDPWLDGISELRPMLYPRGLLQLGHSIEVLGALYWLALPAVAFALQQRGHERRTRLVLTVSVLLLWALPLYRERYVVLAAPAVALASAWAAWAAGQRWRGHLPRVITLLAVTAGLLPAVQFLTTLPRVGPAPHDTPGLRETLAWLRDRTPPTSYYLRPVERPEFGVMADWSFGAYIESLGQRPAVATNFGWETHGLMESATFFAGSDPEAAERILLKNGVRYVLVPAQIDLERLHAIAEHARALPIGSFSGGTSLFYRLFVHSGSDYRSGSGSVGAVPGLRMVFASSGRPPWPHRGSFQSEVKLFERVLGARLEGRTAAGSTVRLHLDLADRHGRRLSYDDQTVADSGGRFAFRLPYPTQSCSGDLCPRSPYSLVGGGLAASAHASEQQVLEGKPIAIALASPPPADRVASQE